MLGLAQNVLKMYHDSDMVTYQECQSTYLSKKEAKQKESEDRQLKWAALEAQCKAMG